MNTRNITWNKFDRCVVEIAKQMYRENWKPDYIVGIGRGGLPLAVALSNHIDVPCYSVDISLRDHAMTESNCWIPEDIVGYSGPAKQVLVVDDINDTGATFKWLINDWQRSVPDTAINRHGECKTWKQVFDDRSVRFATLVDNYASEFTDVNYSAISVNKTENDIWFVFPWEQQLLESHDD